MKRSGAKAGLMFGMLWCACSSGGTPSGDTPQAVFEPWDGIWKGQFEVLQGDEVLTTLNVVQRYYSDAPDLQHGRFREQNVETQEVVTAEATNRRTEAGLTCRVVKSTGEEVVHQGEWTGRGIKWFRKTESVEEVFVEEVKTDPDGRTVYFIDGWGRYDGGPKLTFRGRYRKVGSEAEARRTVEKGDYPQR
ncbi:MAG: hypothetical protein ACFB9M_12230 [Myxococcota bacterium]